jgi:hypothetical protein
VTGGSVEYLEYRIPITNCPEISAPISRMAIALEEAASSIGTRPAAAELEEIVVDGPYYQLTTRMSRLLVGHFGVGVNAGPLFDAVHSIMLTVRECSEALVPEVRTSDF